MQEAQQHIQENSDAPLKIRLLGHCEVWVDGVEMRRLRSRATLWLLVLLTLNHDRPVSRQWLQDRLWPGADSEESDRNQRASKNDPQKRAANNLRRSLNDLRQALGSQKYRLTGPTFHTLQMNLNDADVDVAAFDQLVKQGGQAAWEQAAALYRGPLLEECSEEWITEERAFRQEKFLAVLENLAGDAIAREDWAGAIPYLRRAMALDDIRESAHRSLMRALAKCGAYTAAIQVYHDYRRLLRDLFPLLAKPASPEPQTQECYREIRREARRKAQASASSLRPVFTPKITAPPAANATPRHNLPRARTSFVGREQESVIAGERLRQTALLTLTGPGGAGKTRLAQRVAAAALQDDADDYPDGAWLVELAALSELALLPQTVALTLGVGEPTAGVSMQEALVAFLKPRALLLILDNCEHLVEACARLADALLGACERVKILATSRQALGVEGEWLYPVPALSLPIASSIASVETAFFDRAAQSEAVRLFVERARLVTPNFTLTPDNAPAVANICCCLDGLPLAIELAAARIRALSPEQIAARMDAVFSLLTGGSRTAPPRQQTLRAAIDWSYALLPPDEQTLFARLCVFVGGFTLDGAEAVCQGEAIARETVLDALTRLLDKSLLNHALDTRHNQERFHLLEILRQYGREKLEQSGEADRLRERHLDFCLTLAEQAEHYHKSREQTAWHDRLDTEHDNLREALAWSLRAQNGEEESQQQNEKGLRLAAALWSFWNARGYGREGRIWLAKALEQNRNAAPSVRAHALHGAGALALKQGDYAEAKRLLESALGLRSAEDTAGRADTLTNLGIVAAQTDEADQARSAFQASLQLNRQCTNVIGVADTLVWMGTLAYQAGETQQARTLFSESQTLYQQQGNTPRRAYVLNNLAILAHEEQQYARARRLYRQCLELYRQMEDKSGIAMALNNMGNVLREEGNGETARALLMESLAIRRALEDTSNIPFTLNTLGLTLCLLHEWQAARECFLESAFLYQQRQERAGLAYALAGLADVAAGQGQGAASARLLGMVQRMREEARILLPPGDQRDWEHSQAAARALLPPDLFEAAWQNGRIMPMEQLLTSLRNDDTDNIETFFSAFESVR